MPTPTINANPYPGLAPTSIGGYTSQGMVPGPIVMPMPSGPHYTQGNPFAPAPYQPRY